MTDQNISMTLIKTHNQLKIYVFSEGGKGEGGVPVTNKPPAIPPGKFD